MKNLIRRAGSCCLAAWLLVMPVFAASLPLADSLTMSDSYGEEARQEVLVYEPGGDVRPVVVYGDTLYGRSTMAYIEDYLSDRGYTAAAAINGAFFDMNNGIPYGMVVTDGILRTGGNVMTVGLYENGRVQIGRPELEITMGDITLNYNKALTKTSGFCLYSRDYDTKTKSGIRSYNLILQGDADYLTLSGQVEAEVVRIVTDTKSCEIPVGCFVLSLAEETVYASAMETMRAFREGDRVVIETSVDPDWAHVDHAVGGGDLLVENGRARTEFELDKADVPVARTAIGVKANGDVVCFTVEKSAASKGMTLEQAAKRMQELGCVTAVNLDGGGSTTLGATLPGDEFVIRSTPTDGKLRPCANFLFFVRETKAAGKAVRLHVYPHDGAVLVGGSLELTVRASDKNYMAAAVPGNVRLSADGGTLKGNVFTADRTGIATVTAEADGIRGEGEIRVVETPTTISVSREGEEMPLTSLIIEGGSSVELTAAATWQGLPIAASDSSFTWIVPERLGTVTADGLFTASENRTTGELQVSCGGQTASVQIEIRPNPFVDTAGHWAKSQISALYYEGVLQGSENKQGEMLYRPDDSMTRQEFVVAMMRAQTIDLAAFSQTELPFEDRDKIADWALDAMKAAYALGWFTGSGRGELLYAEPASTITREAAMTILARTVSAESESDALDSFSDAKKVSDWAKPALTAMVEREIINGIDGKLQPQGTVTRAQVAKMLYAMG